MISEPEMAGDFDGVETREVLGDFDREFVGKRRPRRPWLWALGGMVMASVLWAAALFLYGLGDRKPDMHGYQLDQDPCPSLQLKSIGDAIAPREPTTKVESRLLNHAVLDQIQCFVPLRSRAGAERPGNGWSIDYTVGITVALHKKTDPGAEFEARRRVTDLGVDPEAKLETVPNLGDKAYLLTRDDGNAELRVLEGGAVLALSLSAFTQYQGDDYNEDEPGDEPDIPDLSPYQSAMISDMRDLMSSLKQ
ncbi:hypothetical protein [Streptomyces sp. Ncost-T10-10d]|uniref:hypothetical protein n=1 Tax=Streptomyces sp. Ncost-T10-10d TaxID=1839774 RepID=UPI00081D72F0|nr:hypothetical protein [Streptomyces sp. Ncost-T10-10d]SCF71980.1 hypothetical protein GA0115254_1126101 [Streptomyces sp. Ncost-T10-10d]